jgi:transglutaminase-like putative cysteine protease
MKHFLFYTRLALYLIILALPILHPSIVVPYDRVGLIFFFVLVPLQMFIAFYLSPPRLRIRTWLLAAAAPIAFFVLIISGFELSTLLYVLGAASAFVLTTLVFKTGGVGRSVAVLEPFLLGVLAYRMLSFSRASEELARQASGITQGLLILIPLAFLLHGIVLYLSVFHQQGSRRGAREVILFFLIAVPLFLVVSFILPPDFVSHSIAWNRIEKDIKPEPVPLNEQGPGWPGGNLLSEDGRWLDLEGEQRGEGDSMEGEPGENGQNALEGIPSDQWNEAGLEQGGEGKQYAVMVLASPVEPVYAADAYFGEFDAEAGFLFSREEPLNELTYLRFLETWKNPELRPDRLRQGVEITYFSTLPERYIPYRPQSIEPTVLKRQYNPFQYSYNATSELSRSGPREWAQVPGLNAQDQARLRPFLEIPLSEESRRVFTSHLEEAVGQKSGYYERIEAILKSFSTFQYDIGFDDSTSVAKMEDFLVQKRQGDCTEFSNTAAILFRLAGIPARVVTGYLASRDLQSFAHLQGLFMLRQAIPELQEVPFRDLYLVTTAQRHSWVQVYIPSFGWVDLESTAYALPPPPGRNPNSMNVVIPLIQGEELERRLFHFPWLLALQFLLGLAALVLLGVYVFRGARELYLRALARREDLRGLKALYTLLLIKLAERGFEVKRPFLTPMEYAEDHPELSGFAEVYTMLRFRENLDAGERAEAWQALRERYNEILEASRHPGLFAALRRTFSLRGLYYS